MRNITIIAEAGVNHNGEKESAIDHVIFAKKAGADAVKFQLFTERARPQHKHWILKKSDWQEVMMAAKDEGIECFWSVFDFESVDLAKELGAKWVKLSIIERRNLQLIERCEQAGFDRKFVSVDLYGQYPKRPGWEYLYCPNNGWSGYYPTEHKQIEWERYATLAAQSGMGYSCHAVDMYPCVVAAGLGATVIEKHFKLLDNCPDAKVSLDCEGFGQMVRLVRAVNCAQGLLFVVNPHGVNTKDVVERLERLKREHIERFHKEYSAPIICHDGVEIKQVANEAELKAELEKEE